MGKLSSYLPALKYGNKIYPEDIAGMLGLPTLGNIFYVDPSAGSDSNNGKSQESAFKTVAAAFAKTVSGKHDVVLISPTGGTGRTAEVAAINWNKRFTHLIGSSAPTALNPRSGMSFGAGISGSCLTISENGCIFKNLTIASFQDNNVLVEVTGDYNYFGGVHFAGIGNDATGDDTAARSLLLTSAEENLFENCTIGLDTVSRSAANASLELTGNCARNIFRGCIFPTFNDNAGVLFVKADTGNCNERFCIFENCIFTNPILSSSTAMTIGMKLSATGNGVIFLKDCMGYGMTDWTDVYTNLFVNMPTIGTANQGLAVIAAT